MKLSRRDFITMTVAAGSTALMPFRKALALPPTSITSLPITISTSGSYILDSNLSVSLMTGAAIYVTANDVVIDLNGKTITNTGVSGAVCSVGVYGTGRSLTVKNGTVKGFFTGVYAKTDNSNLKGGNLISMVEADACLATGFVVEGSGSVIRGCSVVNHGRMTEGSIYGCSYAFGIIVDMGVGAMAIDNTIDTNDFDNSHTSFGIYMGKYGTESILINNQVSNATIGYLVHGSYQRCEIRDNVASSTNHSYYGAFMDLGGNT